MCRRIVENSVPRRIVNDRDDISNRFKFVNRNGNIVGEIYVRLFVETTNVCAEIELNESQRKIEKNKSKSICTVVLSA